jgi:FMN phosphatase YigB (HAD superfamily)
MTQELRLNHRRTVLFDVDGTLANNQHRQAWVRNKPRNWKAYNATMADDLPIENIINLTNILSSHYNVIVVTARTDDQSEVTKDWLAKHGVFYDHIFFRQEKDYRDDSIVKSEILDTILERGWEPVMVFDDRNRVVDMWRSRGIQCLQVAPGDF